MKNTVDMKLLLKRHADMLGPQVSNKILDLIIYTFMFFAVLAIVCIAPNNFAAVFGIVSVISVYAGVVCTSAKLIEHNIINARLADPPAIVRKWIQKAQSAVYRQGEYFAVNNNRIMIRICITTTRWKQIYMYDDRMHPRVLWSTPPQERPKGPPGKMKMNRLI